MPRSDYSYHVRLTLIVLFLCAGFLIKPRAHAYRPFTTEDAGVGCRGDMFIETSYERTPGPDLSTDEFLLVYGYSFHDRLEISVETPWVIARPDHRPSHSGIGDVLVSGKLLLLGEIPEDGSTPAGFLATLKGAVKTRSGDAGRFTGSGENEYELSLAISRCFGPFTTHLMAGYTWITHRSDDTLSNYYLYGYAMELHLTGKIRLAGELTGKKDTVHHGNRQEIDLLAGILYCPHAGVIFDLFMNRHITGGKDYTSFGLGGTLGF